MTNLIACYLAGNCEKTLDLSLQSIYKHVDKIVVVYDTTSRDSTEAILLHWKKCIGDKLIILPRPYSHDLEVKNANSDARNFYLNYLKEQFNGDWCIVLDADEMVDENIASLKQNLLALDQTKNYLVSVKMVHFIGDLGHEDDTLPEHFVQNRLFKINSALYYPPGEHPILHSANGQIYIMNTLTPIIYHFAYAGEMFYILNRYKNHLAKSEIHTKNQLINWYHQHISGEYAKKPINITKLPPLLKDYFMINDDYFYFKNRRNLEAKHFLMVKQWLDYFNLTNQDYVLDCGCGMGHFMYAMNTYSVNVCGFDKSEYAINSSPYLVLQDKMQVGDITAKPFYNERQFDLVLAIDILEHMNNEEELDMALTNIASVGKNFLFSIPFVGDEITGEKEDPNLRSDETHKIFKTRNSWISFIEKYNIKIIETPNYFYYKEQMLVGRRE